jgi:peroxiredoxin
MYLAILITALILATQSVADFALQDLQGKVHALSKYKGKTVLLNFWATWCPPCRSEMPAMQKLWLAADKNKFMMLAVNVGEDKKIVAEFAKKNGYTFPILLDEGGKVSRQYKVRAIPVTYIINKKGELVKKEIGAREWRWEMFW